MVQDVEEGVAAVQVIQAEELAMKVIVAEVTRGGVAEVVTEE